MDDKKAGCIGCATIFGIVLVIVLVNNWSGDKPAVQPAPAPVSLHEQHEQRLADLKAERQSAADFLAIGIGYEAKIRRDLEIIHDPTLRRADPFPDPNEEQRLLSELEAAVKDNAEKTERLRVLDAEIAKEER
jgi:hypothetical protein